jgi:hypothetical protein
MHAGRHAAGVPAPHGSTGQGMQRWSAPYRLGSVAVAHRPFPSPHPIRAIPSGPSHRPFPSPLPIAPSVQQLPKRAHSRATRPRRSPRKSSCNRSEWPMQSPGARRSTRRRFSPTGRAKSSAGRVGVRPADRRGRRRRRAAAGELQRHWQYAAAAAAPQSSSTAQHSTALQHSAARRQHAAAAGEPGSTAPPGGPPPPGEGQPPQAR